MKNNDDEIVSLPITTKKVTRNVWLATTFIEAPLKMEVEMKGSTEEIAIKKLKLFLAGEPYTHLN